MAKIQTNPTQFQAEDRLGPHYFRWTNGETYQGEFYRNTFHGRGKYTWPDKISYSGFFYVNKRQGYGRQEFEDGRVYTGLYLEDKPFGAGIMSYPDGREDVGFWKGSRLLRLCSAHPSIPSFREIATGYISSVDKNKKMIDMFEDMHKKDPLDEYMENQLGDQITPQIKETLLASCATIPESVFFNKKLFNRIFLKRMENEKKVMALKAQQQQQQAKVVKEPIKSSTKVTQSSSILGRRSSKDAGFLTDLSKPKRKAKESKPVPPSHDTLLEEKTTTVTVELPDGSLMQEVLVLDDQTEPKIDFPRFIVSWNSNPQHLEAQKHTVRHQNFLTAAGFPADRLLAGNRDYMRPPGDVELASNQLMQLAVDGDAPAVFQLFLSQSVYADVSDSKGNTPLLAATIWCKNEVIDCLLDMGVDVNHSNDHGLSALGACLVQLCPAVSFIYSVTNVRSYAEELIMECAGSPIDETSEFVPFTKKRKSVYNIASTSPRRVLEEVSGRTTSLRRQTPGKAGSNLHLSSKTSAIKSKPTLGDALESNICSPKKVKPNTKELTATLKLLMSRGAKLDQDLVPMPPILMAIRTNDIDLLTLLLKAGANPNVYYLEKDWGRLLPIHLACSLPIKAALPITTVLLEHGANPDLPAEDERSVQQDNTTDEFMSTSTAVDKITSEGLTSLLIACARPDSDGALELVKLLLRFKCNPSPALYFGHSPLSIAVASGHSRVTKALLDGGADPNRCLSEDLGPILAVVLSNQWNHKWSLRKKLDIVHELILHKANVVGPYKLMKSSYEETRFGSIMDYMMSMYSKERKLYTESKPTTTDEEKEIIISYLTRYIRVEVRKVLTHNLAVVIQRQEIIEELNRNGLVSCIGMAICALPPKQMPMEICYECCKSSGTKFFPCQRCYSVMYCSKICQNNSWDAYHKDECFQNDEIPMGSLKNLAERLSGDNSSQTSFKSKTTTTKKPF